MHSPLRSNDLRQRNTVYTFASMSYADRSPPTKVARRTCSRQLLTSIQSHTFASGAFMWYLAVPAVESICLHHSIKLAALICTIIAVARAFNECILRQKSRILTLWNLCLTHRFIKHDYRPEQRHNIGHNGAMMYLMVRTFVFR